MKKTLENYEQTKDKALRLLSFRSHSEKELREKLKAAGASYDDIERAVEFCMEYNFLNDEAYAKAKARDLQHLKKYGKRRIEAELRQKGISSDLIEEALSEMEFDEEESLYPLVLKKLGDDFERKSVDRCIRYFIYRGYNFRDIKSCIERAKGEFDEF